MGRLRFMRNTKVILNMSCSNYGIQGEENQGEECHSAHLPNSELMIPLNPSLTPDPLSLCVSGKRAPDNSYPHFYTAHKAHDDIH